MALGQALWNLWTAGGSPVFPAVTPAFPHDRHRNLVHFMASVGSDTSSSRGLFPAWNSQFPGKTPLAAWMPMKITLLRVPEAPEISILRNVFTDAAFNVTIHQRDLFISLPTLNLANVSATFDCHEIYFRDSCLMWVVTRQYLDLRLESTNICDDD